ncbi:Transcription elongation factor A protein 1 [Terramyces sp. JEL0728]|nr:Transcription elongation factor A protein 1 [Terramyces sp. JEL0728]
MTLEANEIPMIKNQISKALKEKDFTNVADLLSQLEHFKASTETLKSTRIGVFVTDIRKHPDISEDIKSQAKVLVNRWKHDIGRTVEIKRQDSISSQISTPTSPVDRTVTTDNIKVKNLGDKVRIKCTEMIYAALATGSNEEPKDVLEICEIIEKTVFAEYGATNEHYKKRFRALVSNLKDKSNPTLKAKVVIRKIKPDVFALMSTEDMMSEDRRAVVDEAAKEALEEATSAQPVLQTTDMFRCGRCKQRKATYYQMQTRSADEPMTTFVTCQPYSHMAKIDLSLFDELMADMPSTLLPKQKRHKYQQKNDDLYFLNVNPNPGRNSSNCPVVKSPLTRYSAHVLYVHYEIEEIECPKSAPLPKLRDSGVYMN